MSEKLFLLKRLPLLLLIVFSDHGVPHFLMEVTALRLFFLTSRFSLATGRY